MPAILRQDPTPKHRSTVLSVAAAIAIAIPGIGQGQSQRPDSGQKARPEPHRGEITPEVVKAVMLLKYAEHLVVAVGAPDRAGAGKRTLPVRIGLVGDDATAAAARRQLPHLRVGDRDVVVVDIDFDDAVAGRAAGMCELLYLATPIARDQLEKVIAAYATMPLPLVSERPGFAALGGDVQIFLHTAVDELGGKCFRAEINRTALQGKGVHVSAQLLKLSKKGPVY